MLFVRCKDGVSHNPAEYSRPEDCAAGAQILLGAYLRYDQYIRQQHVGQEASNEMPFSTAGSAVEARL
jgi:hypothetical protein